MTLKHFARVLCGLGVAAGLFGAQPVIRSRGGVLNSASYRTPGLPASGIAQGSIFTLFGTGLGPASIQQASTFPLPANLAGTSIKVKVGDASSDAILLYTMDQQVAAILPSTVPVGSGTLTLTYGDSTSDPYPIEVVASAFGIYTINSAGIGQAIATDVSYKVNTIIHTFHPGDTAILWGTGLGAIASRDDGPPPVGNLPGRVQVYVGNTAATVRYQGRSGCCSGLDQIVFDVPAQTEGCSVPVSVEAGGALSNVATIAVSSSGQTCHDSVMGEELLQKLASGHAVNFGYIRLEGGVMGGDYLYGTFSQYTPDTAGWAQYGVSSGYCVAVDCSNGCAMRGSPQDLSLSQLDAGPSLVVGGPSRPVETLRYGGYYYAQLNPTSGSKYLWGGGTYTVNGAGGTRVGPISLTQTMRSNGSKFTNISNYQRLSRATDLTLKWNPSDFPFADTPVTIGGLSATDNFDAYVYLQCSAPAAQGQFNVPSWLLQAMPASGNGQTPNGGAAFPLGFLWIGQYETPIPFTATGLDRGVITSIANFFWQVQFQ